MFCFIKSILQSTSIIYILANVVVEGGITGGIVETLDKAPYIVQLINKDGIQYCRGSLIMPKHVITAAHCVDGLHIIVAGASITTDWGIQSKVTKKPIVHPDYVAGETHSDIAVVELDTELRGPHIATVPLCKVAVKEGDYIQAYGWGRIKNTPVIEAIKLHTVSLSVQADVVCRQEFADFGNNMFCASSYEIQGICDGDSGGPAISNSKLCGIKATSKCGLLGTYVFVSIPDVRDFIDGAVGTTAHEE